MKKVLFLFILILFGVTFVNADTNGVWHFAKDVRGGIFGSDDNISQYYTFNNSLYFNVVRQYGNSGIQFKNNSGINSLFIGNDGKVGIGTSSPSQTLDVQGNIEATAYYHDSDIRLKKNIKTIKNPIEKIKKLEGVEFDWKQTNKSTIGLIAQDVEKIIPEIVNTNEEGFKSVEYSNLVALLIEVVKEQQKQIEELQQGK